MRAVRSMPDLARAIAAGVAAWACGCAGPQSALDPAGPQAQRIGALFWGYFGVSVGVYLAVATAIVLALVRRGSRRRVQPLLAPNEAREWWLRLAVGLSLGLTTAILFVLLTADFVVGRSIRGMERDGELTIKVVGHQWWWEVQYQDPVPGDMIITANEVHIPVGRTVRFELGSADVIHSFWIPNLHGKRDLIPGHPTRTSLRADRPGTYLGQCAEFCGLQHAFMRLPVVAESEAEFQKWAESRRRTPAPPSTDRMRRGRQVFLGSTCVMCHTVRGTGAMSRVGPDLTHLASRPYVGELLPNTRGHLAGWVVDPQRIKPGIRMPLNPIRPEDLDYLLDYLESLK
jgi:cytochrome c oxidase subunit 2